MLLLLNLCYINCSMLKSCQIIINEKKVHGNEIPTSISQIKHVFKHNRHLLNGIMTVFSTKSKIKAK